MKKRILLTSLLVLSIVGCTNPILNNTSQYSDLDKEYSQFKTQALTQSYLKKKMDKWLTDSKYSKNLIREIEYAKFKHPTLLKDIVALQPTMFNSITGDTGVSQKRSEPSFETYIQYINPFPGGITATSATNITSSSFTANWNAVNNATGYKLYLDGNVTPITLGNVTTYDISSLIDGSSHTYYVKAINSAGESSVSNTINLTLLSAAPVAISATAITSSGFTANWNAVSSATGYKLYIDGTPITLGLVTTSNVTGLTVGSLHSYYVKATNSAGDSSVSNTINLTLLSAAPVATSSTDITSSSFTANWNSVNGATGYKLYIDGVETVLGNVTSYTKTGLVDASSHNYYVKATNSAGDSSVSNTINLTLLLNTPTATSATNILTNTFTANWNPVTNATGYKLYLDGSGTAIVLGNVTTYNVTGLTKGSSHSYYVKAINAGGESSVSNTINLDTLLAIDEFRVNSYTTNGQLYPSTAMAGDGRFVISWMSWGQDGDSAANLESNIYAQKYNADGSKNGSEFRVNSYTNGWQSTPSVAMADDGKFVISWDSDAQDGNSSGIYAQKYNADGSKNGGEFRVNSYTAGYQGKSSTAMADDGRFVISWMSNGEDGSSYGIYAQKYNANGSLNGSEFLVNTYTTSYQEYPSVTMSSDGRFIIAWDGIGTNDSDGGIFAQRYYADGSKNGSEFRVNTHVTNYQVNPSVAMDYYGRFVISWDSYGQDGDTADNINVYAQKYLANGLTDDICVRVNSYTTGIQENQSIAMTDDGKFVIAWHSQGQDGSSYGIYAQKYNSDRTKNGSVFLVNTYTADNQQNPSIAMDANGNFINTWYGAGLGDNDNGGIFAKRFDSNGNVL